MRLFSVGFLYWPDAIDIMYRQHSLVPYKQELEKASLYHGVIFMDIKAIFPTVTLKNSTAIFWLNTIRSKTVDN